MVKLYFGGQWMVDQPGKRGINFGLPPTTAALEVYLDMMSDSRLPWIASVFGDSVLDTPIARAVIERGGHLRVGIEDAAGRSERTNAEMVAAAAELAAAAGRPVVPGSALVAAERRQGLLSETVSGHRTPAVWRRLVHLGKIAAEQPGKAAVIMAGSGRTVTFAELDAAANRLAHVLFESGLRPGGHLAFMLENRWEFLAVAWAAQRSGLYYTAVSTQLQADECAYIVNDCGAEVFIASAAVADVAVKVSAATPQVRLRLMMDSAAAGFVSYEEITAAAPATPLPRELEGGDMLYSSGTTGRPKGIRRELTLDPIGTSNSLHQLISVLFPPDGDSVYLSPAPLYHSAPLRFCVTMHRFGVPVVLLEKFDPERALAAIETYRVTHSQWVPTMFIRMLKLPAETRARYDVSSMRYAIHAAAPCPAPVKEQMIDWWGPVVHEYYSATEGAFFVYAAPAEWLAHKPTVGRPVYGEPHVCDADGAELPVGEAGILYFSGGPGFEYHGDPVKTAASLDPQGRGWVTVGDVGYLDEEGFIYLTDRASHMIISGGVNIYPQEAENLLAVHPKVADVAVIGVPDPEMGEEVKAVVQPASMDDAGPELAAELIAHCRDHLAHYKCPQSVDFRADLPRNSTGKLLKRVLRDEYARSGAVQQAPR